jgi:MoaA/NifB/PqqE/SkfB family radical SAM enzyme
MTTDQIKDILHQAADLGCLRVRFTGGEPLLRPDFEDLYLFARRSGLKVILFTNGRLITPRLADLLARIPPLEPIEISVYGMRAESYEAVARVPGSFAQFRRGADLLLDRQVVFVVKGAFLPPNREELDEFERWAATLPGMTKPPSQSMFFELRGRRDDPAKNSRIVSLRVSPEGGLAVLTRDETKYREEMAQFCAKFMRPPGDRLFSCGAGHGVCVDAYGRAQLCLPLRAPELSIDLFPDGGVSGGRSDFPLRDALEKFADFRDQRATNPEYLRRCAICFLKGLCEQCPAKSWSEHGALDAPVDYLCQVAHAQARYLRLLDANEHGWEVADWRKRIERTTVRY